MSLKRVLIIAQREYRQIVRTRAFIITLLSIPIMMAIVVVMSSVMRPPVGDAYIILDRSGAGYGEAIERRLDLDHQRAVLNRLAGFAQAYPDRPKGKVWSEGPRWFNDAEVRAFIAQGGAEAALRDLGPGAKAFTPPKPRYVKTTLPAGVSPQASPEAFGAAVKPLAKGKVATPLGPRPLVLSLYIPPDFGQGSAPVGIWTNGRAGGELLGLVQGELSQQLRLQALREGGLGAEAADRIQAITAPVTLTAPPRAERDRQMLRSAAPAAMSYFLLMTLFITGSMMLQSMIEERSNKLVESILGCVTPDELMQGKLFGICGVGLTIVAFWILCVIAPAGLAPMAVAQGLQSALATLNSPVLILAAVFYYLTGYVVISMLFLAVGAMSESMQDAQGYLTPLMFLLMVPFFVLPSAAQGGGGVALQVMSWIPIYTPFAMLARLGGETPPLYEAIGSGLLLLAFMALEFVMLGRVFRASLLGRRPKMSTLGRMMLAKETD